MLGCLSRSTLRQLGHRPTFRADLPTTPPRTMDLMDGRAPLEQDPTDPKPPRALGRIGNALALTIGGCAALMALCMIAIAVFGQMGLGRVGAGLTGGGLLLVSAPLIALTFSRPLAKGLLLLAMTALAVFAGWLCFWPQGAASPSPAAQAAVIAFAALLLFRVYLARRGRGGNPRTG